MYGAAWATVIGQIISAAIAIRYFMHYHTVTLEKQHFIPSGKVLAQICSLGMSSGINQIAMMIVQIVMNNLLKQLRRTVRLWRIHPDRLCRNCH